MSGAAATPADDIFEAHVLLRKLIEGLPGVDADLEAVLQRTIS
jgi:hypothetical protein